MKYIYPAIFTKEGEGYSVSFPDLEDVFTCGDTLSHALEMAQDVLPLMLRNYEDSGREIPKSSDIQSIRLETPENEFVTLISADTTAYRKKYNTKSVKKTLTIPEWLNEIAEAKEVNFSQVLQKALKEELQLQ